MTVAQRMYLLVISAVLGLVSLAGLGYFQINKVFDAANYGNVNTVPSLMVLNSAMKSFSQVRVRVYRHVLNSDATKMAEIEINIKEAQDATADAFNKYETGGCLGASCVLDEKDRQLLAAGRSLVAEYAKSIEPVLELSRQNKTEQARDLMTSTSAPIAEKLNTAIEEQIAYNAQLGKKGAEDAVAAKGVAVTLSIVVALVILVTVGAMGVLIVRNLQSQLGGEPVYAAEVVSKIVAGDMTVDVQTRPGDNSSMLDAIKWWKSCRRLSAK